MALACLLLAAGLILAAAPSLWVFVAGWVVLGLGMGELFTVLADSGDVFEARNVIVAAGGFATPNLPMIPGEDTFNGKNLHAYAYRNPAGFEGKRIIVVGGGNSAVQIAAELAHDAEVTLATRGADPIPARPFAWAGPALLAMADAP